MSHISIAKELKTAFPGLNFTENEPMSSHCTFRIGGCADLFVRPGSEAELCAVLSFFREKGLPAVVIGNGSNLLVHDEGIRGAVIQLGQDFAQIRLTEGRIFAEAGAALAKLAVFAREHGLGGMEFAHGIPGTLGGAVLMNAGAYGGEMKDVVESVRYLSADGTAAETSRPEFSYRHSRFSDSGEVILGATLRLQPENPEAIHSRMMELWEKRSASQPLEKPSAGSTFKRPRTGYAAALIQEAGLKGASVGGAQVSEKHSGFVINTGSATFGDVTALMAKIQETVFEKFGVELEPEVKIL